MKCQGTQGSARPLNRCLGTGKSLTFVRQRGKVYKDHAEMVLRSKGIEFFALRKCEESKLIETLGARH